MEKQTYSPLDFKSLRTLYKKGAVGESNRITVRLTMTPNNASKLGEFVEIKRGGYASPLIELALEVFIACLRPETDFEELAHRLKKVIRSQALFLRNLKLLIKFLEL